MNYLLTYVISTLHLLLLFFTGNLCAQTSPKLLLQGFRFTEGPAVDRNGSLYFSDVPARRIYRYGFNGSLQIFLKESGGVNGLYFTSENELIACSGKETRAILSIDSLGKITEIISEYDGKKLNSPNDLWVDPSGGIYFTDPRYGNREGMEQDGEHVYFVFPDRDRIIRVIDDLVRPNGIVGTNDGKKLYVVDQGVQKTYVYKILKNGKLANKTLFTNCGIDGMSVNQQDEVFITAENAVRHFNQKGKLLQEFNFSAYPTNVFFHKDQLFITTQAGEVHQILIK